MENYAELFPESDRIAIHFTAYYRIIFGDIPLLDTQ